MPRCMKSLWWPRGSFRVRVHIHGLRTPHTARPDPGIVTSLSPESRINSGLGRWTPHSTTPDSGPTEVEVPDSGLHNTGLRTSELTNIMIMGGAQSSHAMEAHAQVKCLLVAIVTVFIRIEAAPRIVAVPGAQRRKQQPRSNSIRTHARTRLSGCGHDCKWSTLACSGANHDRRRFWLAFTAAWELLRQSYLDYSK